METQIKHDDSFVLELQRLRQAEDRRAAEHPFIHRMLQGTASEEAVQVQCIQFYFHTVAFVSGLTRLAARLNVPEIQKEIAEGVYEEYTGKLTGTAPHLDLYFQYARSWGLTPERLKTAYALPETLALINWYMYAADHLHPLVGISVFNVGAEGVNVSFPKRPGLSRQISDALQRHYGKSTDDVLFWDLHDRADQDHSGSGVKVLAAHAQDPTIREQIRSAVRTTTDCWYHFIGAPEHWRLTDCWITNSACFY